MTVQSVIIPRDKFTLEEAKKWILDHNYTIEFGKHKKGVDIKPNYYRFRQARNFKDRNYYIVTLPNGIKLVNY